MSDGFDQLDPLIVALRELAAGAAGHDNDAIVPPGKRACPICGQAMATLAQHGVTLDTCDDHGVWLDQGELATLLERAYRHRRDVEDMPVGRGTDHMDRTGINLRMSINRVVGCLGVGM